MSNIIITCSIFLAHKHWNDFICSYIYIKILENEFVIIVIYVDDINIVGTLKW